MTTADLIRLKLAELRTLDPRQADDIENTWPEAIATLDMPDDFDIRGLPMMWTAGQLRTSLIRELDERIMEAQVTAA